MDISRFMHALIAELELYKCLGDVSSVYIGGGTPTYLTEDDLIGLIDTVNRKCEEVKEFTVEANPGSVDLSLLRILRQAGVNRLSIGAQSFLEGQLEMLGRRHSPEDIVSAVENGRSAGFENISLDLIFAIPGSTVETWEYSLQSAIDLGVEHVSAYALTIEDNTPFKEDVETGRVVCVDEETDREMYYTAIEKLAGSGFEQYEISNFARRRFECRHNLTYWANRPWIGVGPSAGSWYDGRRFTNIADIGKYVEAIETNQSAVVEDQRLSDIETACQTAVLNLRRTSGIDIAEFKRQTGFDVMELFGEVIEQNVQSGMLKVKSGRIMLTYRALAVADSVLCEFASV